MANCNLQNKTAIVTGGAQGLGKAMALAFAAEGADVVIVDIDIEKAELVLEQAEIYDVKVDVVQTDVSCSKDLNFLVEKTVGKFGKIDILVNNAGICPRTPLDEITENEWQKVLDVNLKSVFLLSQLVLRQMKKQKTGRIINMASGAGKVGGVQVGAHYSASKAGIICLTKTLALEGAKFGVNVNAICPGVMATEMTNSISADQIDKYEQMIPLSRLGTSEDIANAALFLASEMSSYITGEILDVNGGFIMD